MSKGDKLGRKTKLHDPVRMLVYGYAIYILAGWIALCLPISHRDKNVGILDHLFIATSAVSTTGLATVSPADTYNTFGQAVVAVLMQFGGLGYMTVSSFLLLLVSGKLSMIRERVSEAGLPVPTGLPIRNLVRTMVVFTLIIETIGALLLYLSFVQRDVPMPAWSAVFHSVSAFCTAGFSLFNDSFESFRPHVGLNATIAVLSYLGALGFIVLHDLWLRITRRKIRMSLSSRVILWSTFIITLLGTVLLAFDEPQLKNDPAGIRWLTAWFQSMTASTTVGFNTIPISELSAGSVFLIALIMLIGASPSGTGGGIKTTTVAVLLAVMFSVLRGKERTSFGDREIPLERIRLATSNAIFYLLILAVGIYALSLVETTPLSDLVFECASAIGTVGLSRGITPELSSLGKCIIILLMFAGRVGPLALGLTLLRPPRRYPAFYNPREDIAI